MNKTFIGNGKAFEQIGSYLSMDHPGPLILFGPKGTGKRIAARSICCELLGCTEETLNAQPDFYLLDKKGDSIKVEDILKVLEKSAIAAVRSRKAFLILDADRMNAQAQNKLLKLLEDRNLTNTVIMVCEENNLLPTIQSRCIQIGFVRLPKPEMDDFLSTQGIEKEDIDMFAYLCECSPYRADDMKKCFPALKKTYLEILSVTERREILQVMHLVKEKDAQEFFAVHGPYFDTALNMLLYIFSRMLKSRIPGLEEDGDEALASLSRHYSPMEAFEIAAQICRHRNLFRRGSYTKNDFFDLARIIA